MNINYNFTNTTTPKIELFVGAKGCVYVCMYAEVEFHIEILITKHIHTIVHMYIYLLHTHTYIQRNH